MARQYLFEQSRARARQSKNEDRLVAVMPCNGAFSEEAGAIGFDRPVDSRPHRGDIMRALFQTQGITLPQMAGRRLVILHLMECGTEREVQARFGHDVTLA